MEYDYRSTPYIYDKGVSDIPGNKIIISIAELKRYRYISMSFREEEGIYMTYNFKPIYKL